MIFKKIWSILSLIIFVITGVGNYLDNNTVEGGKLLYEQNFPLEQALIRAQGVTTDNDNFYFSSNLTIIKTTPDGDILKKSIPALPASLLLKGVSHIGGISYSDGKIYCGAEDSANYIHPYVLVYDSETLKLLGSYPMSYDLFDDGVPWVAADGKNKLLYTSVWKKTNQLYVFDLETMQYQKSITLSKDVERIQGGEMYDGKLYLSIDTKNTDYKEILRVDVNTGKVDTVMKRHVSTACEAEGMTFRVVDGQVQLCVLDVASMRASIFFRYYSCDFMSLG